MTQPSLTQLQQENSRLQILASYDELTGILNRRAMEKIITSTMGKGGAMFICDMDNFKSINDTYGHLVGDRCLKETAALLKNAVRTSDIVGRYGGDEFIIFAYGAETEEAVNAIKNKISHSFDSCPVDDKIKLSLTIGSTIYEQGDDFESILARADAVLLEEKRTKKSDAHTAKNSESTPASEEKEADDWGKDLNHICHDLVEVIELRSAFYQNYDTLKQIYRFIERGMSRRGNKACLLLISLVDVDGQSLTLQDKEEKMARLESIIPKSLRLGDVYTRYSSCQYLLLLTDIEQEQGDIVADRIIKEYQEEYSEGDILFHYCSELQPALIVEKGK